VNTDNSIQPVTQKINVKKHLLLPLMEWIPRYYSRYYEPFLGAGEVLLALKPHNAVINNSNEEIINVYKAIKSDYEGLIEDLRSHKNEPDYLYYLKKLDQDDELKNLSQLKRASRTIFLYKINELDCDGKNGTKKNNVPLSHIKSSNLIDENKIRTLGSYLNKNSIRILNQDFETALDGVTKNAFVFFNPPVHININQSDPNSTFNDGFSTNNQIRLKNLCDQLDQRGIRFILSVPATNDILDLYRNYQIRQIKTTITAASDLHEPKQPAELFIRNFI